MFQLQLAAENASKTTSRCPAGIISRIACAPGAFRSCWHARRYVRFGTVLQIAKLIEYPHKWGATPDMKSTSIDDRKSSSFNPQVFLRTAGLSRTVSQFQKDELIYSQGETADTVQYIQKGGVKLSVVNGSGKEAVVAMFGENDFFGEACLGGQLTRMGSARAISPTTLLTMGREELLRALHAEHDLSDQFIAYMLGRVIRVEEDLIDQLFNSSEKRLARTLLLLARYGEHEQPDSVLPKVSQETLAEMIGTTRARVNFFMNKFRKLGFIEYNSRIKVKKSLLSVVLHD